MNIYKYRKITHPKIIPFEYTQVTPEIFIGTNQCCTTHFEEELLKQGVGADISLEWEHVDKPLGVDYFLWLPVKGDWSPTKEQLDVGVAVLEQLVKNKIKVYVHCKNGHGRAPTLVAAYLIKSEGLSARKAISFLTKKRPVIHLTRRQFLI